MLRPGRVAGLTANPPGGSWSAARFRPAPNARRPLRPLCSELHPWGLGHISKKEREQVATAARPLPFNMKPGYSRLPP
eukprot:5799075-Pyramimonas_sp.AAC.1